MSQFASRYEVPSEAEVEHTIKALGIKEFEAQDLRAFYQREREAAEFNWRGLFTGFAVLAALGLLVWAVWQVGSLVIHILKDL